jgi:membrane protease YdiL (CAAX protease family)
MLTPIDHVLVVLITILLPVHDLLYWYPRLLKAEPLHAGKAKSRAYLETIVIEWGLCIATLVIWSRSERTWSDLGLGASGGWGFWAGAGLALGVIVFGTWQRLAVTRDKDIEVKNAVLAQLESLKPLLPQTPRQLAHFSGVAVTAGICEELLFRGFLIWYLDQLVPTPVALFLAAALFGMAHAYQGTRGVLQTGLVGVGLVILYVLSGSLWIPMLVHAFIDLNTGLLAYTFLARRPRRPPDAPI